MVSFWKKDTTASRISSPLMNCSLTIVTIIRGSSTLWVYVAPILPSYSLNIIHTTICYFKRSNNNRIKFLDYFIFYNVLAHAILTTTSNVAMVEMNNVIIQLILIIMTNAKFGYFVLIWYLQVWDMMRYIHMRHFCGTNMWCNESQLLIFAFGYH